MMKLSKFCSLKRLATGTSVSMLALILLGAPSLAAAAAQETIPGQAAPSHAGGEASLVLPDLGQVDFHGINARTHLTSGL